MARRDRAAIALLALVLAVAACTSGSDHKPGAVASSSAPLVARQGPVADLSQLLSGGNGVFIGSAAPATLPSGWIEEERVAAGRAVSYHSTTGDLPADGRFDLATGADADFRTRVLVRHPADPTRFNGTVVVEWLNVSAGLDAAPDYQFLADELLRGGYAWAGVSAQYIGVEGGPVAVTAPGAESIAGKGLRHLDAARYGALHHPGDAFAYDIYTQVARAVRAGDGLDGLVPERVLAVGESQSAFMLTTYANGVQPLTHAFDGFLIHSRGAAAAPLGDPASGIDVATTFVGTTPIVIRDDLDVPVFVFETETDVISLLGYVKARQPNSDRFRAWEVAGTAHADRSQVGALADTFDCGGPINDGPQRFVVRAALRTLDRWVRGDGAPPVAPPLDADAAGAVHRDEDGIVEGGVRTPLVDVPTAVLSGVPHQSDKVICLLLGSTTPLPTDRLVRRYGSRAAYLDAFTRATDAAIAGGFVLPEDRAAVLATAHPELLPA